jgi:hypothetical protein
VIAAEPEPERLRAKPGQTGTGPDDRRLRDHRTGGTFRLADLVFNSIMSLTT